MFTVIINCYRTPRKKYFRYFYFKLPADTKSLFLLTSCGFASCDKGHYLHINVNAITVTGS